ncbi:MAG: alpha/beta hydrolase [Pseudomonadota bacterium]
MKFKLHGQDVYASTGGRDHVEGQPWLIFLHGAGSSHLVWNQQSRSFAYNGFNVLAVDFPGHNLSSGKPRKFVETQAAWLISVMNHLNIDTATLVGHSQGGLVALYTGAHYPSRVTSLVFVATAAAIPVGGQLIANAEGPEHLAKSAMTSWGMGPDAHHFENSVPGFSNIGVNLRTMDLNPEGAVANDLKACAAFQGGTAKAALLKCPTMTVFADRDKMTPIKFGLKLAETLPENTLHVLKGAGHTIPLERPIEFNEYLRDFLAA